MNRNHLIEVVSKMTKLTQPEARQVVNTILEEIQMCVHNGRTVQLRDFGTFSAVERKARKGRNIKTGEVVDIPARKEVKFKAHGGWSHRL